MRKTILIIFAHFNACNCRKNRELTVWTWYNTGRFIFWIMHMLHLPNILSNIYIYRIINEWPNKRNVNESGKLDFQSKSLTYREEAKIPLLGRQNESKICWLSLLYSICFYVSLHQICYSLIYIFFFGYSKYSKSRGSKLER